MSQVFSHSHMPFKIAANRSVSNLLFFRFFSLLRDFAFASKLPITASMWMNSVRNDNECDSPYDNRQSVLLLLLFLLYEKVNSAKGIRKPHCVWKMYAQFYASITIVRQTSAEKNNERTKETYKFQRSCRSIKISIYILDRALNCITAIEMHFEIIHLLSRFPICHSPFVCVYLMKHWGENFLIGLILKLKLKRCHWTEIMMRLFSITHFKYIQLYGFIYV